MRPSATTRPCCRSTGFTLLEILVAMVVLALIVTSAFGALRLGERSWEAGHTRSSDTETLRTVSGVLQRQFKQLLPLTWEEDAQTYLVFDGNPDKLRFIAPAPLHRGATGLYEFTLSVESEFDTSRLVLHYRLHDPDIDGFQPEGSASQRVLLVENLKTARFAYYGSPVRDEPPQWYSQWSNEAEAYPRLIKIALITQDEQRQWPELYLDLPTELER